MQNVYFDAPTFVDFLSQEEFEYTTKEIQNWFSEKAKASRSKAPPSYLKPTVSTKCKQTKKVEQSYPMPFIVPKTLKRKATSPKFCSKKVKYNIA